MQHFSNFQELYQFLQQGAPEAKRYEEEVAEEAPVEEAPAEVAPTTKKKGKKNG